MSSVLAVNGGVINRAAAGVILNRWTISYDRPDELEFTQLVTGTAALPGAYAPEQTVTLSIGGATVFSGWIFARTPSGVGTGRITVGYRALGLKYGAYLIAVTASDGSGTMVFNLPTTDQNYVSTEAGLSVGAILTQVFNQHSAQLAAIGVTSYNSTDLSALTVVPPEAVYIQGNTLWSQVDQLLQTWYGGRYVSYITAAGVIRVLDTTLFTGETLTFGSDPIVLDSFSEDTSECYTQVILRGRDNVQPAYLSVANGTLVGEASSGGGWTPSQQAAWNLNQFLYPTRAWDSGSITGQTSTTITVSPSVSGETWITANYWSGISAQVAVINPAATNITGFEYKHITANTALSSGSYTITVDSAFVNTGYTLYQIRGNNVAGSNVWRDYQIPNTYVAQHLTEQFNFSVPWSPSQGEVVETNYPAAVVCYSQGGVNVQFPAAFEVIPYNGATNGYIRFYAPVVQIFNTTAQLNQGGSAVQAPTDVQVLVPYSRGTLTAQYPSSGYGGTAYTQFNVERTLYRDYPTWIDANNAAAMTTLAQQIFETVSNTVQEGSVTYYGQYANALNPGSPIALSLASALGTIGYESMAAPCRTVTLEWPQDGAAEWVTRIQFSTRRQQYSGDKLYVHPNYAEGPGWFRSQDLGGGLAGLGGLAGGGPAEQLGAISTARAGQQGAVDDSVSRDPTADAPAFGPMDLGGITASLDNQTPT